MTLIELIAALALAGFVLLGAILLLDGVDDTRNRIARDARSMTADGTAADALRDLLANAWPTFDTARRFDAGERELVFSTRCPAPAGWSASCRAMITVASGRDSSTLRVRFDDGESRILKRCRGDARFRYFDAERGRWTPAWSASASVPAALAVVVSDDTVVYSLGASRD
jgi:hypothetical protein